MTHAIFSSFVASIKNQDVVIARAPAYDRGLRSNAASEHFPDEDKVRPYHRIP